MRLLLLLYTYCQYARRVLSLFLEECRVSSSVLRIRVFESNEEKEESYPYEKWTATASMNFRRFGPTETLLSNGKVLVAGGWDGGNPIISAELFIVK
jgi:hypothetical protein